MITIITGVPGSGKTAYAVDLLLQEFKGDRLIFNDGLDNLQLEHHEIDVMQWHEVAPDGALIIADEVQRKWRPRGPSAKVPESIAQLETHRHRGIDFILITQNLKLIDQNVRALAGRHVHIRDTGFLGRWLYEWPEADTANSWKRCENKRRYKLPKRVFSLYKSASMHTKPVRTTPTMVYIVGALLLGLAFLLYVLYGRFTKDETKPDIADKPETTEVSVISGAKLQEIQPEEKKINDLTDWIPRVSTFPESAPAYDEIRQVVSFPYVVGGVCMADQCICVTQQGTNAGLAREECAREIKQPRFNPYLQQGQQQALPAQPQKPPVIEAPPVQDERGKLLL